MTGTENQPSTRARLRWALAATLVAGLSPGLAACSQAQPKAEARGLVAAAQTKPSSAPVEPQTLPGGRTKVFDGNRFLVAYYGTVGTGSLGVLGETSIDEAHRRLVKAAAPFRKQGERIQPVYELIVTVVDAHPGADGDFNHDISHAAVADVIKAAHRNKALVVLDLQPGRSDFLTVAKRWKWALKDPYVGLALDPEWRMKPGQIPAQVIGSVRPEEVNRVSRWLNRLTRINQLPEKVFMLHTFRTSMLPGVSTIKRRKHLAEVMHVDGFGPPSQKLGTYHAVARPKRFVMGFKVFYDEDVPRMSAAQVRAVRPAVKFVSFQ